MHSDKLLPKVSQIPHNFFCQNICLKHVLIGRPYSVLVRMRTARLGGQDGANNYIVSKVTHPIFLLKIRLMFRHMSRYQTYVRGRFDSCHDKSHVTNHMFEES